MQFSNSSLLSRQEILELPYEKFIPGRLWTPEPPEDMENTRLLLWTTVLVPAQLNQINSQEEYFLLLVRRVEWLIEQAIQLWLMDYGLEEEKQAEASVAMQIMEYTPIYMNSLSRRQSPRQMATHLVMNYQELQQQCFPYGEQQFPVTPHLKPEESLRYLEDMNLIDWLMWMNMDANPHYFQD